MSEQPSTESQCDERISDEQYAILEQLVGIPSAYTQEGPDGNESKIQHLIHNILDRERDVSVEVQPVGPESEDRFNIIAYKGAPLGEAEFTLMMYVHDDTVGKEEDWEGEIDFKLVRDGKVLRGIGVHDMKAGVMTLIHLLQHAKVPKEVTFIGLFGVGEEVDSDGMKRFMESAEMREIRKHLDMVLSPEINSLTEDGGDMPESDNPKDTIYKRPGHVKVSLVATAHGGHAFNKERVTATDVLVYTLARMNSAFNGRYDELLKKRRGKENSRHCGGNC